MSSPTYTNLTEQSNKDIDVLCWEVSARQVYMFVFKCKAPSKAAMNSIQETLVNYVKTAARSGKNNPAGVYVDIRSIERPSVDLIEGQTSFMRALDDTTEGFIDKAAIMCGGSFVQMLMDGSLKINKPKTNTKTFIDQGKAWAFVTAADLSPKSKK